MIAQRRRSLRRRMLLAATGFALAAGSWHQASSTSQAQDITWTGGASGNYNSPGNWDSALVPGAANTVIIDGNMANAANVFTTASASAGNLTITAGDSLTVSNSHTFTIAGLAGVGTVNNDGLIDLNSGSTFSSLSLSNPTDFTGSGTLRLSGPFARVLGGGTLNNNAGHTIEGRGALGSNALVINNDGMIDANVAMQSLIVDPRSAGGASNSGTMRASNQGLLVVTGSGGGALDNTGGTILALDASEVNLTGGANVTGGTLNTVGSGEVAVVGSATVNNLINAGQFTVRDGATLTVNGNITNNGQISIASNGGFASVSLGSDTTLTGNGSLDLSGDFSRLLGSGTLTNDTAHTIAGRGELGSNAIGVNNLGWIDANVNGETLLVNPSAALGATNDGTMQASNGGTLTLSGSGGGSFDNTNGLIQALDASNVLLSAAANVTGGTITSSGTGAVSVAIGGATLNHVTNTGQLNVADGNTLTLNGALENTGRVDVNSGGLFTQVSLGSSTAVTGTGTLSLNNAFSRVTGSGTLTNAAGHSIVGRGDLGTNSIGIDNQGLIDANVAGAELRINPSAALDLVNSGTMQASNGGRLNLNGSGSGDFTNTGTIQALDASTVLLDGGAIVNGGTLNSAGTGAVNIGILGATLNDVDSSALINVNDGSTLTLNGTLNNTNQLNVNSAGLFTNLNIGSDTQLNGTGTVALNGSFSRVQGSGTLTNTTDHSIVGGGELGRNAIGVNNQGLIDANVNGGNLVLDPSAALDLINTGTMQASNGGTLTFSGNGGGDFQNAGTIQALDQSSVVFSNAAQLDGGILTTSGSGVATVTAATFHNVTNNGQTNVTDGATMNLSGTLTNNGRLDVNSAGLFTNLVSAANTTLAGQGTVSLNGPFTRFSGSGVLTNGSEHTIAGGGELGRNALGIINQGTILANGTTKLSVDPSAAGNLVNQGLLAATGPGVLEFSGSGGGSFSGDGTVRASDGGTVRFLSNATVQNVQGNTLSSGNWEALSSGSTTQIEVLGVLPVTSIGSDARVKLSGADASISFGTENLQTSLLGNAGRLTIADGNVFDTVAGFSNSGQMIVDGMASELNIAGMFAQSGFDATTLLIDNASITAGDFTFDQGALRGNGSLTGDAEFLSDSLLAVGQSAGILNINGNANLLGSLEFELGGALVDGMMQDAMLVNRGTDFGSTQFDQVNIFGDAVLDGSLDLEFINGFVASGGDFFDVLSADSLTLGSNFMINGPAGFNFDYSVESLNDVGSGSLRSVLRFHSFSAVPEPSGLLVLAIAGAALAARRRRKS